MRAAIVDRYGPPEVVQLAPQPEPPLGAGDIRVRVAYTTVTTADWRLRASAFPGGLWLIGRLVTGLFRPRARVLGGEFSGEVTACGANVRGFVPGDRVFGFSRTGAHAEMLSTPADGAVAHVPDGVTLAQAASLPFGALCALVFFRDIAGLQRGDRVLILGATGGVGAHAVQIARAMGARVSVTAHAADTAFVKSLGAEATLDRARPLPRDPRYDVIFDTVGAIGFAEARRALAAGGRFVPLNFGLLDMLRAPFTGRGGSPRLITAVNGDTQADMREVARLAAAGLLTAVVDQTLPLDQIVDAHRRVETRHKRGSLLIDVAGDGSHRSLGSDAHALDRPRPRAYI